MAANYAAFRNRRSLLLLNLKHQVRIDELPWVQAVADYRDQRDETATEARAALVRLGELALDAFPATVIPNALVTELDALGREAGLDLPLVEELAADIFMGSFSAKFVHAAKLAGQVLEGSLYARYYAIDYADIWRSTTLLTRVGARRSRRLSTRCASHAQACRPADTQSLPTAPSSSRLRSSPHRTSRR